MQGLQTLSVDVDGRGVATVTMTRPDVKNAFDDVLIAELTEVAGTLAADDAVRVVVLTGAGEIFSAGADLNWMGSMLGRTVEENVADAQRMNGMYRALYDLPKPLVGRVNGHALGGGAGLVAVCDIVVAVDDAWFGFTEVVVGIVPAVISPYVVRAVGHSHARALFVTGERFSTERAERIGLVHHRVARAELDDVVADVLRRCLRAGPRAAGIAKALPDVAARPLDEATARTPEIIATVRVTDEAQEGMRAFLEKRRPSWRGDDDG